MSKREFVIVITSPDYGPDIVILQNISEPKRPKQRTLYYTVLQQSFQLQCPPTSLKLLHGSLLSQHSAACRFDGGLGFIDFIVKSLLLFFALLLRCCRETRVLL